MAHHVVGIGLFSVARDGTVMPGKEGTIAQVATSNLERRIVPTKGVDSSMNYPTIVEYLDLEEDAGFDLVHIDQYTIITKG